MDAYHKSGDDTPELVYRRGRLEVGPATGRLRCHLCGLCFVSLCQHALLKHRVSAAEYRVPAGDPGQGRPAMQTQNGLVGCLPDRTHAW
jgi:hypothetical protein